jgi:predicted DCC family thiol-disulfide oxidoreductase YuxK
MSAAPKAPGRPRGAARAVVRYDRQCARCRKSVSLRKGLDWLGALTYADVRRPDPALVGRLPVPRDRLLEEMHLLTAGGREVYHGFRAFRWMAWRLPLLWPLVPLLYLPGAAAVGQRAYLWVARNRFRLVPCHGGVCKLGSR